MAFFSSNELRRNGERVPPGEGMVILDLGDQGGIWEEDISEHGNAVVKNRDVVVCSASRGSQGVCSYRLDPVGFDLLEVIRRALPKACEIQCKKLKLKVPNVKVESSKCKGVKCKTQCLKS